MQLVRTAHHVRPADDNLPVPLERQARLSATESHLLTPLEFDALAVHARNLWSGGKRRSEDCVYHRCSRTEQRHNHCSSSPTSVNEEQRFLLCTGGLD